MLNAIILEDEPNGRVNLKNLLQLNCPQIKIIAEAGSIEEGLQLLENPKKQPDLFDCFA